MNKSILERMEKYKANVIRNDYPSHVQYNSIDAYDEGRAVRLGHCVFDKHSSISKDDIKKALLTHNTDLIFEKVKNKFHEIYGFDAPEVNFLNNRTMGSINAFYHDDLIFLDRMIEDTLHEIFMITFIWAKYFDDEDLYGRFFNYMTTAIYAAVVDKGTYNIYQLEYIKKEIDEWSNVINIASCCQYFCIYFCIAHEYAHKYIASKQIKINKMQEEFKADAMAYDIVLQLMEDEEENCDVKNRELFDYCYLVPIMMLDCLDLLFYSNRLISGKYVENDGIHPKIKSRKEHLFSIPYSDKYKFDTEEGNAVYGFFLDVTDKYKTELLYRKENGMLNKLIKYLKDEV